MSFDQSSSKSWSEVMDLLSAYQREAQQDVIGGALGAAAGVSGWEAGQYPGLTPGQQSSLAALEQSALANVDYFQSIRDQAGAGPSGDFLENLTRTVDAPVMEQAGELGRALGVEGAGAGHYGTRTSSDLYRGKMNIGDRALQQIAQQRSAALMGDEARRQGRGDAATQSIMANLQTRFGMQESVRQAAMQALAYREQFRQNQLNAKLAALGLAGGISTSVGMGIGSFGETSSMGISTPSLGFNFGMGG